MLKPQSAVSGFAKCGIYPFDPSVIATDKLAPAATFDRDQPVGVPTSESIGETCSSQPAIQHQVETFQGPQSKNPQLDAAPRVVEALHTQP